MLVLSRREDQSLSIIETATGEKIATIHVMKTRSGRVRLGIDAKDSLLILRGEIDKDALGSADGGVEGTTN